MNAVRENISERRRRAFMRSLAISPFTILLLGFGVILWIIFMFTIVPYSECGVAYIWTVGWQNKVSLLQLVVSVGVLFIVSWIILLPKMFAKRKFFEAAAQGIFLAVLGLALISLKTFILPFGAPDKSAFDAFVSNFREDPILFEDDAIVFGPDLENWRYDYPPPPDVQYKEHPMFDPVISPPMRKIFRSDLSPQVAEIEGARQCYIRQHEALAQYEKDQQTLEEYWRGFYAWRAANPRN